MEGCPGILSSHAAALAACQFLAGSGGQRCQDCQLYKGALSAWDKLRMRAAEPGDEIQ